MTNDLGNTIFAASVGVLANSTFRSIIVKAIGVKIINIAFD